MQPQDSTGDSPINSAIKSLLSLTGQVHMEEFPYDEIITFSICLDKEYVIVGALGKKETRVVDIAVLPEFRKKGIASALLRAANCNIAYVVSEDAENFWHHIGWKYFYDTIDNGTKVKVFVKERKTLEQC